MFIIVVLRLRDSTAAGSLHQGSQATYKTRDEYRSKQKGQKQMLRERERGREREREGEREGE